MPSKTLTVAVTRRGELRIPRGYRRRYRVGSGERLRVLDVGGLLILLPPDGRLPGLQRRFAGACRRKGVTMKELGGPARED